MTTFEIIILVVYYLFTFGFTLYEFGVFDCEEGKLPEILLSIFLAPIVAPVILGVLISKALVNKLS